jgi:cytochrome c oxidase subunit 3
MNASLEERRYRIAVWIVIASEALLFAGLFALYTNYRSEYPHAFAEGVKVDVQWMGGANTFILLTSSFCIAWAIHLMRGGRTALASWFLLAVLVLGGAFLVLKLAEWGEHAHEGVVPGIGYYHGESHGRGTVLFFTLYYFMTGLHALHVVAGLCLVTWVYLRVRAVTITRDHHLALELVAMYWHFVDVVWVFLWPMFYLMRE